ncbi:MAG: sulfatase [Sedimentisphaerales bacterium]|nr:sulfatase [Sedimentisphaerales bacterium]
MNRRMFIQQCGVGLAILPLSGCGSSVCPVRSNTKPKQNPNILWIISEDTSPDMACYDNPVVQTPHLDQLACEGVRYTGAFASGPVCSAVRSGLMTGMYQTTIDAHHHRSHRTDGYRLPPPVELITEYFRRAGYFTSNAGNLDFSRAGKTDWNFDPGDTPFDGTDWRQRRPGQPFFAQINLPLTHRNFVRDKQRPIDPASVEIPPYYPDHPLTRRDWADYLESIQVLDRMVGQVLDRLEKDGLADNTIVFYFGDHGRCHVRGKQWLYEGGIRIPLLIRYPGYLKAGSVCDDLVSTIDLGPTSMHWAGIPIPDHMQGQPFLGKGAKKRDRVFCARDRCDATDDRIRCIRTRRYKYIRNFHPDRPYLQFNAYKKNQYPVLTLMQVLHKQGKLTEAQERFMSQTRPQEELYDLRHDPHEIHNLAADPKSAQIIKDFRDKLERWIRETDDKGRFPEPVEVREYWDASMMRQYGDWMKQKGLSATVSDEKYLAWWEKKMLNP